MIHRTGPIAEAQARAAKSSERAEAAREKVKLQDQREAMSARELLGRIATPTVGGGEVRIAYRGAVSRAWNEGKDWGEGGSVGPRDYGGCTSGALELYLDGDRLWAVGEGWAVDIHARLREALDAEETAR